MPRLSDSMEEGTIIRWLVDDGAEVARGDELAEIETDKATMTFEADADGRLHRVAAEGDTLAVGAPIAHLLGDGEEPPEGGAVAEPEPALAGVAADGGGGDGEDPRPPSLPGGPAVASAAPDGGRVKASPLARRVALELGVDLGAVTGSGPNGRIVRADVEAAVKEAPAAPPAPANGGEPAAQSAGGARGEVRIVEPTSVQRTIARRMSESKATIPDFQVRTEADVTRLLELRRELKAAGPAASVNDFVVKASALALREHPRANGAFVDDRLQLHGRVNVGVAVAGEGTLIVPTVFDADRKAVTEIAAETRELAAKVREGRISPPELSGGTFTVSNLGMFGVTSFTAIVNPGQAAILAVGAAVQRPVPGDGGELVVRSLMDLSLSCDHRILYGADAASFLARIRELLDTPYALIA